MLEPQKSELRIGRCLSESFTAWTNNLPVLFVATILAFFPPMTPFLLLASITGLVLLTLDAMDGQRVRIRSVFRPLRHPVRFTFLYSISLIALALWLMAGMLLFAGILPSDVLPDTLSKQADGVRRIVSRLVSEDVIGWLPAYGKAPHNWGVILPAVALIAFLAIETGILWLRCFYLPIIAADKHTPLIDAYVESRNTVLRIGYARHIVLILLSTLR